MNLKNFNDLQSYAASVARFGRGVLALAPANEPELPVELFEFEVCPYCRKVRETLSELDLDYVSRSAARGSGSRDEAIARGGKRQFPWLHDPNTGETMYESEDIVDYLHATYGAAGPRARWRRWLSPLDTATSALASGVRMSSRHVLDGLAGRAQPAQRLELWNFEGSPFCRKVREELNVLGLDTLVHNVAKYGRRRPQLVALGGKMQVPYLVDPNTGVSMYESDDIVAYLRETYGER
jgi:glutathione S-transferase